MLDALLKNDECIEGMTKEESQTLLRQCVQRVLVLMQVLSPPPYFCGEW